MHENEYRDDENETGGDARVVHGETPGIPQFSVSLHRVTQNHVREMSRKSCAALDADFDTWIAQMRAVKEGTAINANTLISREECHARQLKRRSPQAWKCAVELIPDKIVRTRVACIVWWDYFAGRRYVDRWPHLDKYLDREFVPVQRDILSRALHAAGYSPWHATWRLNGASNYYKNIAPKRAYRTTKVPKLAA